MGFARNMRRVRNKVRYWSTVGLSHVPPYRSTSVFVLGHPRTGTNWLCRMLSQYLEIPLHRAHLDGALNRGPLILHLHRFAVVPERTVYMLRDGRDVVVSYYFKSLNSLPSRKPGVLKALESYCAKPLVPENARANLPGFLRFHAEENRTSSIFYSAHVRKALRMGLYTVRYEDLRSQGEKTLGGIVRHLTNEEPDWDRVRAVIETTTFERTTGRKPGEEDLKAGSARKGIVGDWRNYFTREAAEVFDRYAGEMLVEAGYEPDRSWVQRVPE